MAIVYAARKLVTSNLGWFHRTRETLGEDAGRERAININASVIESWFPDISDHGDAPFEITNYYYSGAIEDSYPKSIIFDSRTIRMQGGGKNWRLAGNAIQGDFYDVRVGDLMLMSFEQESNVLSWIIIRSPSGASRTIPHIEASIYNNAVQLLGHDKGSMWLPEDAVFSRIIGDIQQLYPTAGKLMMTDKLMLENWKEALESSGFYSDQHLARRFIAALKTKRFAILTGLTGSGKTLLARSFAKWICESETQYAVIPVGANWIGNENIVGYPDALNETRYHKTPALEVILNAVDNPDKPHFIILDEMNLSHVERYFADFLSAIESPSEPIFLYGDDNLREGVPKEIERLPSNLYIIGTVNVDETTYMFSPKVLDRANVVEFRAQKESLHNYLTNRSQPKTDALSGLGSSYSKALINATSDISAIEMSSDKADAIFVAETLLLTELLSEFRMEIGFRSISEIARYFEFNIRMWTHDEEDIEEICRLSLDEVLIQKILPRLHGSRRKLEPILRKLLSYATIVHKWNTETDNWKTSPINVIDNLEDLTSHINSTANNSGEQPFLPLSSEKITRMNHMLEDGFASFAEA